MQVRSGLWKPLVSNSDRNLNMIGDVAPHTNNFFLIFSRRLTKLTFVRIGRTVPTQSPPPRGVAPVSYEILSSHSIQKRSNGGFCLNTLETKLRSLQIKLNLRVIVTNAQLHGFDMIDKTFCCFCKTNPETVMHLICDCYHVCQFWEVITSWLCFYFKRSIKVNNFNKLFGFQNFELQSKTSLLNCFSLHTLHLVKLNSLKDTKETTWLESIIVTSWLIMLKSTYYTEDLLEIFFPLLPVIWPGALTGILPGRYKKNLPAPLPGKVFSEKRSLICSKCST